MKLNLNVAKPNLEQPRSIRDQNDPSIGSELEPFMKLNSNVAKPNLERNQVAYDQNDPSIL